jgi:hypothetical protein
VWLFYALVAVAVIRLRQRGMGEPPDFRAPFGLLAPGIILTTAACVSIGLALSDPWRAAIGAAAMASCYALYRLRRRLITQV